MVKYNAATDLVVLLATYNSAKYLTEQLDSLFSQTYLNWTLYVHDDGSSDETMSIISDYQKNYTNVVIVDDGMKALGPKKNFIHLLEVVAAKYYMFCDHDDVWLPTKVELTLNEIKKAELQNPLKPVVFHSDLTVVDGNLNVIDKSMWHYAKIRPEILHHRNYAMVSCYMTGCTIGLNDLAKTELALDMPDDAIMHDWWIGVQAAMKGAVIISCHQPTILYRLHGNNDSGIPHNTRLKFLNLILKSGFQTKYDRQTEAFRSYFGVSNYYLFKLLYNIRRFLNL